MLSGCIWLQETKARLASNVEEICFCVRNGKTEATGSLVCVTEFASCVRSRVGRSPEAARGRWLVTQGPRNILWWREKLRQGAVCTDPGGRHASSWEEADAVSKQDSWLGTFGGRERAEGSVQRRAIERRA